MNRELEAAARAVENLRKPDAAADQVSATAAVEGPPPFCTCPDFMGTAWSPSRNVPACIECGKETRFRGEVAGATSDAPEANVGHLTKPHGAGWQMVARLRAEATKALERAAGYAAGCDFAESQRYLALRERDAALGAIATHAKVANDALAARDAALAEVERLLKRVADLEAKP